eukprot:1466073-Pleurochrysis_carterae.AAC.1
MFLEQRLRHLPRRQISSVAGGKAVLVKRREVAEVAVALYQHPAPLVSVLLGGVPGTAQQQSCNTS